MIRYSAAQARQHLSAVLDAAERGEGVRIERRGVEFELRPVAPPSRRKQRKKLIVSVDPAVQAGRFGWVLRDDGLHFRAKRAR